MAALVSMTPIANASPPQQVIGNVASWTDSAGDQLVRRTDLFVNAPLHANFSPHDLQSLSISAWAPANPTGDLLVDAVVSPASANFFRMDLVVGGVAGPPGPLGSGFSTWNPFIFSDNPLYGFIEIDMDGDPNTGGESLGIARKRYLAQLARLSESPGGPFSIRAAKQSSDVDSTFATNPQFERSGAEFSFTTDLLDQPIVVTEGGDMDGRFEAGETWVVRGEFFELVEGSTGFAGFLDDGPLTVWHPPVNVRFSHDIASDKTTVSMVFALTQEGARQMAGAATVEPLDFLFGNQTSVEEAVCAIITGAPFAIDGAPMYIGWAAKSISDFLDPTQWGVDVILALTYTVQEANPFAYTDAGFDEKRGDFSFDGAVTARDDALLTNEIAAKDGTAFDGDFTVDGVWTIKNFGPTYTIFDMDYDGAVGPSDRQLLAPLFVPGDIDGDKTVGPGDLLALLAGFGACPVPNSGAPRVTCPPDLDADGSVGPSDLLAVLSNWGATG